MADQAAAVAADGATLTSVEAEALVNALADGDDGLADPDGVARQAREDLRNKYQAEGGDYEDLAYQLGAAKEEELKGRQDGTPEEHYDELLHYAGGLERAAEELIEEEDETEEAASLQEPSLLANPFVPGVNGDELHYAVHLALIPCSLVRHVKGNPAKLVDADLARGIVPGAVTEALAPSLRGGEFRVVGGAAVRACPVLLTTFTHNLKTRFVLLVAARATSNVAGWLTNAAIRLVRPPPEWGLPDAARVHAGFLAVTTRLGDRLFEQIDAELAAHAERYPAGPPMEVVFAGHSLGGAVATLLAARRGSRDAPATLVTFGGPRVGNDALQDAVYERTVQSRVVTSGDPVPGIPLWWLDAPYAPAKADAHWELLAPDGTGAGASSILQRREEDTRVGLTNGLSFRELYHFMYKDHRMDVYLERMLHLYTRLPGGEA